MTKWANANSLLRTPTSEPVDIIVVGYPRMLGDDSESMTYIRPFVARLRKLFPQMEICMFDERFTSTIATAKCWPLDSAKASANAKEKPM